MAQWTNEEVEYLQKNAKKMTYQQIAEKLGRSHKAVNVKASRLNIKGATWTKEEDEFIGMHAASRPIDWIAKRLNRTPNALRVHMIAIGVGDLHMEKGTYSAKALGEIVGVSHETVRRWILDKGLPAVKMTRHSNVPTERMRYHIDPDDFWRWANDNRKLIDFNRIEPRSIPPEPDWVNDERRRQFTLPARQKIWEPEEDQRLIRYYYTEALSQTDIAQEMGRTLRSIEKRLKRLREK